MTTAARHRSDWTREEVAALLAKLGLTPMAAEQRLVEAAA